jgi:hypothetical protein
LNMCVNIFRDPGQVPEVKPVRLNFQAIEVDNNKMSPDFKLFWKQIGIGQTRHSVRGSNQCTSTLRFV